MGLLPVGPKRNNKVAGFPVKDQEYDALNVQHKIIARILLPLTKLFKVRIEYCIGAIASIDKVGRQEDQRCCVGMERLGNAYRYCLHSWRTIWKMSIFMVLRPIGAQFALQLRNNWGYSQKNPSQCTITRLMRVYFWQGIWKGM